MRQQWNFQFSNRQSTSGSSSPSFRGNIRPWGFWNRPAPIEIPRSSSSHSSSSFFPYSPPPGQGRHPQTFSNSQQRGGFYCQPIPSSFRPSFQSGHPISAPDLVHPGAFSPFQSPQRQKQQEIAGNSWRLQRNFGSQRPYHGFDNSLENRKKRKRKVNKKDLVDYQHFCDICNQGFKDAVQYTEHIDAHEKCPREGCSYAAAPKMVQMHLKLQHQTGIAGKVWNMETKDEIDKWISERKKNFPTTENIAKKKATEEEMVARGEVLKTKCFGKMSQNNWKNKTHRNRWKKRRNHLGGYNAEHLSHNVKQLMVEEISHTASENKKDLNQQGEINKEKAEEESHLKDQDTDVKDPLSFVLNTDNSMNEESFGRIISLEENTEANVMLPSSLATILLSYGKNVDCSESSEETISNTLQLTMGETLGGMEGSTDQLEIAAVNSTSLKDKSPSKKMGMRKVEPKRKKLVKKANGFYRMKPTLLEKLLGPEIKSERNTVLQCIRYVIKTSFLKTDDSVLETTVLVDQQQ